MQIFTINGLYRTMGLWIWINFFFICTVEICYIFQCTNATAVMLIIIHIRHFSGKIKPHILRALLPKYDCGPYHTILPFFREISPLLPYSPVLMKSAISDHIPLFISSITRIHAQRLCALESRIARSVTMERRLFAHTLLWCNNHIHDTLLAV